MADLALRGVSVSCQCACSEKLGPAAAAAAAAVVGATSEVVPQGIPADGPGSGLCLLEQIPTIPRGSEDGDSDFTPPHRQPEPAKSRENGIVSYCAELHQPLVGAPLRVGEVWHLHHEDAKSLEPATLSLYANGFEVRPDNGGPPITVSWSPFSLVQACRLHSVQADAALPWLRLFKVSVFHHGAAHHFASRQEDAEASMRARWVADVARALRMLTASLFPPFRIRSDPVPGAAWTSTRLVAGYLLMCDNQDVALVYCELHAHWDHMAAFSVYEDEHCKRRVTHVALGVHTCISERVGVDCGCFSIDGHHFAARSSAEKAFWLRAVSNVKVKLRHGAENPTRSELKHYRASVAESAKHVRSPETPPQPLLQRSDYMLTTAEKSKASSRGDVQDASSETGGIEKASKQKSGLASRLFGGLLVQAPSAPMLPCESGASMPISPPEDTTTCSGPRGLRRSPKTEEPHRDWAMPGPDLGN